MATTTQKKTLNRKASSSTRTRAQQHPVATKIATVPDKQYADEYINRKFHGKLDFDIFDVAYEYGRNVLIEGPTGPGKTSAVLGYAASRRLPFYAIPSNVGIEPSQLFGKYIPGEAGGFIWQDGPVTDIFRFGGVLLINEANFMPERVATVMFGALDKRREIVLLDHKGEVIRSHRGKGACWCDIKDCDDMRVLIVADMNPDYEGTRPLNKALRNRFAIQLDWDYDVKIETQLVRSGSLISMAEALRQEAAKGGFETPISTNMLQEFEEIVESISLDFAIDNFVNHFASDERPAVLQIVKTYRQNIIDDLDDDEEEADDDEWGVEGVDWVYEDENDDDNDNKVAL